MNCVLDIWSCVGCDVEYYIGVGGVVYVLGWGI